MEPQTNGNSTFKGKNGNVIYKREYYGVLDSKIICASNGRIPSKGFFLVNEIATKHSFVTGTFR